MSTNMGSDGFSAFSREGGARVNRCPKCLGWVHPADALDVDSGRFHDRCLSDQEYEVQIAEQIERDWIVTKTEFFSAHLAAVDMDWREHLDEEHSKPLDVGRKRDRYIAEEISPALAVISIKEKYPIDYKKALRGFCE